MATLLDGYLVGLSTQARDGVPVQQLEGGHNPADGPLGRLGAQFAPPAIRLDGRCSRKFIKRWGRAAGPSLTS